MSYEERRHQPRATLNSDIQMILSSGQEITATINDISLSGIHMNIPVKLQSDNIYELMFEIGRAHV